MSKVKSLLIRGALFAAAAGSLHAQFGFSYRSLANPSPVPVDNNGSVTFPPAALGASSEVTIVGRNNTAEPWSISSVSVSSPVFKVSQVAPDVPPFNSFLLTVTFSPATPTQATANLTFRFSNTTGSSATYNFFLFANGQAPQLVSSYVLNPDGNQVPIGDAGSIAFPQTALKATSTATFIVVNRGNGAGTVRSVALTGDNFKLSGLPLLPAQVDPGKDVRFTIAFTPLTRDTSTGSLSVDLGGRVLTIALSGQGAGATLLYEFATPDGIKTIGPEDTVHLPAAAVGATSNGVFRVRNAGNADARVASVSVVGTMFRIMDLPPLPVTIPQGGVFSMTLAFTPRESGLATGRILLDGVSVALDGMGTGSRLSFSSRVGSTVSLIADGGSVTFPNATVGTASQVFIRIENNGNAPGAVNGIAVSAPVFALSGLPALPATISPGDMLEFTLTFTPAAVGSVAGTLQVDDRAIGLRGVGNAPPSLPGVSFTGFSDSVTPLQQPSVGLTLAEPYSLDLTGKLTLAFTPDSFVDDPSVQFATGGRTVDFRIPANTTQAIFGESARAVQFQTGTVAGVIGVSASFAAGAANLTPAQPPSKTVLLASSAPQIRNLQVGTRTANSFELLVTGLSTTRSVSQFTLDFTAAPGMNLGTTNLAINVEAPFTSWYGSAAGRTFGSQFTASVIINVAGDINAVQSVSVTASNPRGASNAATVNLR